MYGVYHLIYLMKFSGNKMVLDTASLYEEPDFKIRRLHCNNAKTDKCIENTMKIVMKYPYRFNSFFEYDAVGERFYHAVELVHKYGIDFDDSMLYGMDQAQRRSDIATPDGWEKFMRAQLDHDKSNKWITGFLSSSWEIVGEPADHKPFIERAYKICKEYGIKCVLRCLVDYRSGHIQACLDEQWNNWRDMLNSLPFDDFEVQAYSAFYCEQQSWNPSNPKLSPILNDSVKGEKVAEFKFYDETLHGGCNYNQMNDPIPQCRAHFWKDRFIRHMVDVIAANDFCGGGDRTSDISFLFTFNALLFFSPHTPSPVSWAVHL